EPDRRAPHVVFAEDRILLAGANPRAAYLDIPQLIAAARSAGADAMHPGYGFLAENPAFAEACVEAGITFIGPSAASMRAMGDQVAAAAQGTTLALGERDCSIQRRHQKLVEETPAVGLKAETRAAMAAAAVRAAEAVRYQSAGTIEFIFSGGQFYFLEMNTRLQVEHPITEMVLGMDLVREQIRIARGESLSADGVPASRGHAIEF